MTCFYPLDAWKWKSLLTPNGKSVIWFNRSHIEGNVEPIKLACSQCFGCRMERSKDWAVRCVHEAQLWENNCFITLTFRDEDLERAEIGRCEKCAVYERNGEACGMGSLCKKDFQDFMKRLRKSHKGIESYDEQLKDKKTGQEYTKTTQPIRYFHCGEYGSKLLRPHHHACLFNFDFSDKYLWDEREGVKLYRSKTLEKLWPFGYSTIGEVTFESAAYVARYITKKVNGSWAKEHYKNVDTESGEVYQKEPEYITMSRRPGVASRWFEKYKDDVFPKDYLTLGGRKFKSPKYYDKIYDECDPTAMAEIKNKRKLAGLLNAHNNTPNRLRVRETVKKSQCKSLIRSYENHESENL